MQKKIYSFDNKNFKTVAELAVYFSKQIDFNLPPGASCMHGGLEKLRGTMFRDIDSLELTSDVDFEFFICLMNEIPNRYINDKNDLPRNKYGTVIKAIAFFARVDFLEGQKQRIIQARKPQKYSGKKFEKSVRSAATGLFPEQVDELFAAQKYSRAGQTQYDYWYPRIQEGRTAALTALKNAKRAK
jgi:hypothetical protein